MRVYFSLFLNDWCITHCQTVQQVHQHDHDQEHEGEEEDVAERVQRTFQVDRDITELQLSDEHAQCLHDRQESRVKELVFLLSFWLDSVFDVFMKHDVEADAVGYKEESVPDEEVEEGSEDFEEHGDVDVEPVVPGMLPNQCDQLWPGEDDGDCGQIPVYLEVSILVSKENGDDRNHGDFDPVFNAENVTFDGDSELEDFNKAEDAEEDEDARADLLEVHGELLYHVEQGEARQQGENYIADCTCKLNIVMYVV